MKLILLIISLTLKAVNGNFCSPLAGDAVKLLGGTPLTDERLTHLPVVMDCPYPRSLKVAVDRPSLNSLLLTADEPFHCEVTLNGHRYRFSTLAINNSPVRFPPRLDELLEADIPDKHIDAVELLLKFDEPRAGNRQLNSDDDDDTIVEDDSGVDDSVDRIDDSVDRVDDSIDRINDGRIVDNDRIGDDRDISDAIDKTQDRLRDNLNDPPKQIMSPSSETIEDENNSLIKGLGGVGTSFDSVTFGLFVYTPSEKSFWNPLNSIIPGTNGNNDKALFSFPGIFDRRTVHSHLNINIDNPLRTFLKNPVAIRHEPVDMLAFEEQCLDDLGLQRRDLILYHDQPARGSRGVVATLKAANGFPFSFSNYAAAPSLTATPVSLRMDFIDTDEY